MPYLPGVLDLFEYAQNGQKNKMIELLITKCIHDKGYHGAGWAAEAVSQNVEMRTQLVEYLSNNIDQPEVLLSVFNLIVDRNSSEYFTKEEYNLISQLLFTNWSNFISRSFIDVEKNNSLIYQIQVVITNTDYIEDSVFSEEQFNELMNVYNYGIQCLINSLL